MQDNRSESFPLFEEKAGSRTKTYEKYAGRVLHKLRLLRRNWARRENSRTQELLNRHSNGEAVLTPSMCESSLCHFNGVSAQPSSCGVAKENAVGGVHLLGLRGLKFSVPTPLRKGNSTIN